MQSGAGAREPLHCRSYAASILDQLANAMSNLALARLPRAFTICDLFLIGEVANHIGNSTGLRGDPSNLALPT